MRVPLTASVVVTVLMVVAVEATAAPRMDGICKSVDRRGTVQYGDCPLRSTFKPPEPEPPSVVEPVPPAQPSTQPAAVAPPPAQRSASTPPAEVVKTVERTLSSMSIVTRPASRKTYPIVGLPLFVGGVLVSLAATIAFLVAAFRVGVWWGLGCIFVAPVSLVFLVMHWRVAGRSFLASLAGSALVVVGYVLLGGS